MNPRICGCFALALIIACSDSSTQDDDDDDGGGASAGAGGGGGGGGGSAGTSACGHAGEAEPATVTGITAAHNAARCAVTDAEPLPPLQWSNALAAVAQAYADELAAQGCNLVHSSGPYGENLFAGSTTYPAQTVVDAWMSEASCFSYTTFPECCSCTCGHLTQILWRESTSLGCGVGSCGGGQVWVCNYDPPGNYLGEMPY